ncbi:MAG: hypothetical protein JO255_01235 [Alphaproteobacteria bacterium]|nr:hypothetical protein [Alphaproteobacteria bacterium]
MQRFRAAPPPPAIVAVAYRPSDHVLTGRQILAAWLVCLAVAATGFGFPALWHEAQRVTHHLQAVGRLVLPSHHA